MPFGSHSHRVRTGPGVATGARAGFPLQGWLRHHQWKAADVHLPKVVECPENRRTVGDPSRWPCPGNAVRTQAVPAPRAGCRCTGRPLSANHAPDRSYDLVRLVAQLVWLVPPHGNGLASAHLSSAAVEHDG